MHINISLRKIVLITSGIMLVTGVAFILTPIIEDWFVQKEQRELLSEWESTLASQPFERNGSELETVLPILGATNDVIEEVDGAQDVDGAQEGMYYTEDRWRTNEIKGLQVQGLLEIPAIGFRGMIIKGVSEQALKLGIGTVVDGREVGTGNFVLAGHRSYTYGQQFNRLGELRIDDFIQIETRETTFSYQVKEILIVEPTDLFVLQDTSDEAILTLITCEPLIDDAPYRLIIKAIIV